MPASPIPPSGSPNARTVSASTDVPSMETLPDHKIDRQKDGSISEAYAGIAARYDIPCNGSLRIDGPELAELDTFTDPIDREVYFKRAASYTFRWTDSAGQMKVLKVTEEVPTNIRGGVSEKDIRRDEKHHDTRNYTRQHAFWANEEGYMFVARAATTLYSQVQLHSIKEQAGYSEAQLNPTLGRVGKVSTICMKKLWMQYRKAAKDGSERGGDIPILLTGKQVNLYNEKGEKTKRRVQMRSDGADYIAISPPPEERVSEWGRVLRLWCSPAA